MKRTALAGVKQIKDTHLYNLEPEDKEYRIACDTGLYFRVSPTGKKSWQVRFKDDAGKWKWLSIGSYQQLTMVEAKHKAATIFLKLKNKDEVLTKKEISQQIAEEKRLNLKSLMYDWLDTKKTTWAEITIKKETQSIEKWILSVFGDKDYTKISSEQWLEFFQDILRNEEIFNRVKKLVSHCRNAYDLAKFRGQIGSNPLDGILKYLDKGSKGNMKHVQIYELPELVQSIRSYTNQHTAIALELLVLLFPRPQELRYAKWEDFDFDNKIWIKPAHTMKCGIRHVVPLPDQAIGLLKELEKIRTPSDYLFCSRDSLMQPISEATLNNALKNLGYRGKQSPHGFRHIASTALNEQFAEKDQVIESCLAHKKRGVKADYDKATHLGDRIKIMQWWADHITDMLKDMKAVA
ncbi:tyrosine-type recombinase/integrase [Acinetobacter towneri]|uniref:tyrosine-type recombinase/integrase n=1 Tax=Acinetobacter towneri TaxID=202956 RepID=UPI003213EAE5